MYRNPCGLGIVAPIGLTVMPSSSEYVYPGINLGSYCRAVGNIPTDAWRSRVVPPRNLYSSIGGTTIVTTEQEEATNRGGWDGVVDQIPGWFEMLKTAIVGPEVEVAEVPPESSDMPDVVVQEAGFIATHGKLILYGALAVGAFLMFRKK